MQTERVRLHSQTLSTIAAFLFGLLLRFVNTRITDIFLPLRLRPCRFRHVLLRGTIVHNFLQPNPSEVIKKVTNTYLKVRFIWKCACKDVFVNAQARDCIHLLHFTYMIREPSCEHFPHVGWSQSMHNDIVAFSQHIHCIFFAFRLNLRNILAYQKTSCFALLFALQSVLR